MANVQKIAVVGGDGIGPDVINEGLKVLDVVSKKHGLKFETTDFKLGAAHFHKTGEVLHDSTMAEIAKHDAIFLGAGVLERGLLLKMRFAFDQYVNLRPAKLYPGVTSPLATKDPIDFLVVREGTEGPYSGAGGSLAVTTPREVATEVSINTRSGVERVIRYAFELCIARGRKKVTMVHKDNIMLHSGALWKRTFDEVKKDYPNIPTDYFHVDAAAMFFVTDPARFDVVVTDNLFGDILTDISAAITGGIGLACSGNISPNPNFPSMFEPVHGSAPDIAGKNIADPTATVLSLAMMLDHLGHPKAAADVNAAVAQDLATRKPGRSTTDIGSAIAALI
jgi:3-isopropylmalate dehydrogenase